MKVIKRNSTIVDVEFDEITRKIKLFANKKPKLKIDAACLAREVISLIYDCITTSELDEFTASIAINKSLYNSDYSELASRLIINNHIKNTNYSFKECVLQLSKLLSDEIIDLCNSKEYEIIESFIKPERDYLLSYFGFNTLKKSYLLKSNDKIIERPQYLYMRVALGIHGRDLDKVKETYDLLSLNYFTHATPTLFNAGTKFSQMSSCFLIGTEDSVSGIYKTISDVATISKWAGGIGLHISNIRATGSIINSTNGSSQGIMPMLKVYNDTARYINQGSKRLGSFAMYLEPWHADIFIYLEAKKNNGADEIRARDLFYGLWIPDLFMKRLKNKEKWSLMCPYECPGLTDCHSDEFEKLYTHYELEGKYKKQIDIIELWNSIINSQIETGLPYICYKDSVNRKTNQNNLGTIKSSNLCTEIMQYSNSKETAVCNLASICLPKFIKKGKIDYSFLGKIVEIIVNNLNLIINKNNYPTIECQNSNLKHRPIGIGIQGLADVFMKLKIPFTSDRAKKINKNIFETIYYYSLKKSNELSKEYGYYTTFPGSPASKGILQFNMWNKNPELYSWDKWNNLKQNIKKYGLRNSLLVAPMPTASTAQIMGNNESIEPYTSNIYTRRVLSGEFIVINKHLINYLKNKNLMKKEIIDSIIVNKGSVQHLDIPLKKKEIFKTAWEISQKKILEMSAERGPFICQSQSLNIFIEKADPKIISSVHLYGHSLGLKTGSYYIRTKPVLSSQNYSMEYSVEKKNNKLICTDEVCTMCSS